MKKNRLAWRTAALYVLTALLTVTLGTRLAYLQLVQGTQEPEQREDRVTRVYTEIAARGQIYDRNGVQLVSNSLGFVLELDWYGWDRSRQNEVILRLCEVLREAGVEYEDNLPLTPRVPFGYTYESTESAAYRRLRRIVGLEEGDALAPPAELFGLLCDKYGVDEELGIYDKRTVVGMRYYLESCEFSAYNTPVTIAEDADMDTVARLAELSDELPGVSVQVDDIRHYETEYASHVLGRVAAISPEEYAELKDEGYAINDTLGKNGMERALEKWLRGVDGKRAQVVSRSTGELLSEYMIDEPEPGDNCELTLDVGLQEVALRSLERTLNGIRENGARSRDGSGADAEGGAAVVIDIRSGEVLALVSWPTYSLESYRADFAANNEDPLKPFQNRAVASAYPPGSTFKMATAVAALETGIISPSTKIRDLGIYTAYEDYQPRCWIYRQYGRTHGNIDVSDAIKYSCNYFFYDVAHEMGIETLNRYAKALGLGQRTGIELAGERAGNLAGPESRSASGLLWFEGETLSAAIGQSEQQFTPLQLANYVASIVNGGTRYRPHLLRRVTGYLDGETVFENTPEVVEQLDIASSTVQAIKRGMRGVVTEDGTASSVFRDFPMEVGGKTGSAQTTADRSAHGVFVSFAPYDDPEIAVCVVGEYAGSGGSMAPVCIDIYDYYFGLGLNAQPEEPAEPTVPAGAAETPVE